MRTHGSVNTPTGKPVWLAATALRVNPVPVVVADKAALKPVAGAQVYSSVWLAEQTRVFDNNLALRATQVAELAEVAA